MLGSEPAGPVPPTRSPSGDYAALVDAWAELLRSTLAVLVPPGRPGALTVSVDGNEVGPPVRLSAGAEAEVWLRNGTLAAVGPLVMSCGQLAGADGSVLDGGLIRFAPQEVPALPPRSSRAVTVSLAADGPVGSGTYRGAIQAQGAPGLWLPLEVSVP
jgi:hypothetical protein